MFSETRSLALGPMECSFGQHRIHSFIHSFNENRMLATNVGHVGHLKFGGSDYIKEETAKVNFNHLFLLSPCPPNISMLVCI